MIYQPLEHAFANNVWIIVWKTNSFIVYRSRCDQHYKQCFGRLKTEKERIEKGRNMYARSPWITEWKTNSFILHRSRCDQHCQQCWSVHSEQRKKEKETTETGTRDHHEQRSEKLTVSLGIEVKNNGADCQWFTTMGQQITKTATTAYVLGRQVSYLVAFFLFCFLPPGLRLVCKSLPSYIEIYKLQKKIAYRSRYDQHY
jgi:hypothetical protein